VHWSSKCITLTNDNRYFPSILAIIIPDQYLPNRNFYNGEGMNNFRRFALLTTVATYFLIFVGGLVRVAGAGLGCPDWPKCFGRWIPPFSVDQIPDHIDASSFNVVLAWIEYTNRLAGMSIGILILITAILAFRHCRNTNESCTLVWQPPF